MDILITTDDISTTHVICVRDTDNELSARASASPHEMLFKYMLALPNYWTDTEKKFLKSIKPYKEIVSVYIETPDEKDTCGERTVVIVYDGQRPVLDGKGMGINIRFEQKPTIVYTSQHDDHTKLDEKREDEDDDGNLKAVVYLPYDNIDEVTRQQIVEMIQNPTCQHVRVMPDCHGGKGCVIGFTSEIVMFPLKVVPNYIGVDIGCGMYAQRVSPSLAKKMTKEKHVIDIEHAIKTSVKMGHNVNDQREPQHFNVIEAVKQICANTQIEADTFAEMYHSTCGIDISHLVPTFTFDWLEKKCRQIGIKYQYFLDSIGSLGGGNHFIECDVNEENGDTYFIIHSGSRFFGKQVCEFHQRRIDKIDLNAIREKERSRLHSQIIKEANEKGEKKIIRTRLEQANQQLNRDMKNGTGVFAELMNGKSPDCLMGDEAFEYVFDMMFAQNYAVANRQCMMKVIMSVLGQDTDLESASEHIAITSTHNFIDFTIDPSNGIVPIMRKGATSAKKDEMCIIPMNMRDGVLLCRGLGNPEWNFSAPHGAGRICSRNEARKRFTLKQFERDMKDAGVYSTSVCTGTLDESSFAYKDSDLIKRMIDGRTVEIIATLKPIFNIKDDSGGENVNRRQFKKRGRKGEQSKKNDGMDDDIVLDV
jgi:tRNA-splicing ligase RtcB (3'-phosphate/5'-hydroxy nucleic acid ligase)